MISPQKNAVRDQVALFANLRRRMRKKTRCNNRRCHPIQSYKPTVWKTKDPALEHDKSQTAMGSRNGEVKFQIQPQLFLRFRVGLRIR